MSLNLKNLSRDIQLKQNLLNLKIFNPQDFPVIRYVRILPGRRLECGQP